MSVEDTGGSARLRELFAKIRRDLPSRMQEIGQVTAVQAASRAPTPEEEYHVMMVGDGNPEGITNIPEFAASSINDSDGDHRTRFFKEDGLWLQQVVSRSVVTEEMTIHLGDIGLLNESSFYEWRNITGDIFECRAPFWEAWETGIDNSFEIKPNIQNSKGTATVKPGLGKENRRFFMHKTIPGRYMYGLVDVDQIYNERIIPAIQKIAREAG